MTADNRTLFVKFPCLPGAAERAALGICRAGVPAAATEVTRRHLASVQRVSDECGFSALTPRMVAAPVHGTTPAVGACLTRACLSFEGTCAGPGCTFVSGSLPGPSPGF